jgi:ethanolaminephosphotransferase
MDAIIKKIYSKLNLKKNDILIIAGDHAMADQGGHGGSSYVETHVPTVFISNQSKQINGDDKEYLKIDLTPTLSALLGISIPWNNLGILIENVLKKFYHSEKSNLLKCLIDDNRRQLFNLLSNTKLSTSLNDLQLIRDQAMSISNEQDLRMLLLSIILFWSVSEFNIFLKLN